MRPVPRASEEVDCGGCFHEPVDELPRLGGRGRFDEHPPIRDQSEEPRQHHSGETDRLGAVCPLGEQCHILLVVGQVGAMRVHQHVDVEAEHA